ncbi:carbonic anhydrase [Corynebacterium hindlerae]|uniref:Carbonic anhydrase n=1 Tax=Corynebacterium hindlerae TaxID=699041 RepID=A0A7G5FDB2_9CORY|nr:carbonic anhydrase [Corynebacterium hindlerae]QMV84603.1 carbonic anhydrase [Corynebacterium hindlerae]QTH59500.1 carbonic anhydrase [Corynebacterium hindlerae]
MRDVTEVNPVNIWNALKEGNRRYQNHEMLHQNLDAARREELVAGQKPMAAVLACSDSRAPVEHIFDQGAGDIFVIRTAGEVLDMGVFASLEFAVDGLGVSNLIVMGHESCGAVKATKAALEGGEIPPGFQRVLIEKVAPSILNAKRKGMTTTDDFEIEHVRETVDIILDRCPVIKQRLDSGSLGVIGARYRLGNGAVEPIVELGVS